VAALVYLVATLGYRYWRGTSDQDFPQYYMGGVIARLGAWDQLYPVPRPGLMRNPGFIEDSTPKPLYAQEMRSRIPAGEGVRYMQPPPVALLLVPLSFLTYQQAYAAWMVLLLLSAWAIALQAGSIYRACLGRVSYGAGIVTLIVAVSPAAHRWVRVQNVSALMGALIGATVLGLLRRRDVRTALSTWLAGLLKYATGVFVPLFLVMRRWRALVLLVAISVASLLISIAIMGRAPFDEYFRIVAPTLKNTNTIEENQALQGLVARIANRNIDTQRLETLERELAGRSLIPRPLMTLISVVQVLTLLLILGLIFSRWRDAHAWEDHPPLLFAAAAALMGWLLVFSPMYWEHYTAYLAPLWGWVAWEMTRSKARSVTGALIIALFYVPWSLISQGMPDVLSAHILWATVLMLILSIDRLRRAAPVEPMGTSI
jgi:hypothetical protein